MKNITRRQFIHRGARAGLGAALLTGPAAGVPLILTRKRTTPDSAAGTLTFQPYFVQRGVGPHLLDLAYASDTLGDTFHSDISATPQGVTLSDLEGQDRFALNVRWNVEDFGYLYITADNGGEFYRLPPRGKTGTLNLNFELARSRVLRNRRRLKHHREQAPWTPSRELQSYLDLAEGLHEDAARQRSDARRCAEYSQQALAWSLRAGELLELEAARRRIAARGPREIYLGCDARHYFQMDKDVFLEHFTALFNYANITYVVNGDSFMNLFEPREGQLNFRLRDVLYQVLREHGLTVQGRALFWFHDWVTPDWLADKSFDDLKKYVEQHTREVIGHYGEGMYGWEIMNEIHDWANEVRLTPEQITELTGLACEVARDTAPNVKRIINNCCPFAEYVQLRQWSGQPAACPQRTPLKFTRDLVAAGVDFDLIGQQMYFPYRDLQDSVILLERYEQFGKPVQLSEVGAPGGPNLATVNSGRWKFDREPHVWRRPWDDELQADWLEGIYTLAYSKPWIEAINWFDFMDPHSYILNGGLLRTTEGGIKPAWRRLKKLSETWRRQK